MEQQIISPYPLQDDSRSHSAQWLVTTPPQPGLTISSTSEGEEVIVQNAIEMISQVEEISDQNCIKMLSQVGQNLTPGSNDVEMLTQYSPPRPIIIQDNEIREIRDEISSQPSQGQSSNTMFNDLEMDLVRLNQNHNPIPKLTGIELTTLSKTSDDRARP